MNPAAWQEAAHTSHPRPRGFSPGPRRKRGLAGQLPESLWRQQFPKQRLRHETDGPFCKRREETALCTPDFGSQASLWTCACWSPSESVCCFGKKSLFSQGREPQLSWAGSLSLLRLTLYPKQHPPSGATSSLDAAKCPQGDVRAPTENHKH